MKHAFKRINTSRIPAFGIMLTILFLLISAEVFARAGGGGGSGGGGSDSGDGFLGLLIALFFILPSPWNWICLGIAIFLISITRGKTQDTVIGITILLFVAGLIYALIVSVAMPWNFIILGAIIGGIYWLVKSSNTKTVLNKLKPGDIEFRKLNGHKLLLERYPDFNELTFRTKVQQAFSAIQEAWQVQSLTSVRRYISDGVYQRFNTQFKMMEVLKQKNIITSLVIKDVRIVRIETDGAYDVIHTAIEASIDDTFKSELFPQLNSGGQENFIEYWSFIRRKGEKSGDLYATQNCPNCGGVLPADMGEVSRCPHCQTLTNMGDYDWILSEITQAEDFANGMQDLNRNAPLIRKAHEIMGANIDFAMQMIEDKASNGYLQIQTAMALRKPELMRRFVSDQVFDQLKELMKIRDNMLARIYLNDVSVITVEQEAALIHISFAVKSTSKRVRISGNSLTIIDKLLLTKTEYIRMSKSIVSEKGKGSLYAHNCPSCGGTINDSIDLNCQYCGSLLNSPSHEWIITAYNTGAESSQASKKDKSFLAAPDNMKIRDYAFNNIMVIWAADGVFAKSEKSVAERLARRWGYKPSKMKTLFELAESGRLSIRMPESQKDRQRIIKMMEKAARSDGYIDPKEQEIIDGVKSEYP